MRISLAAAAFGCLLALPAFGQANSTATISTQTIGGAAFTPATVISAVNVRSAPDTRTSQVVGTLQTGGTVMVQCSYGWCRLQDGGYVAQKFLNFSSGSFDVVAPPTGGDSTAAEPVTTLAAVSAEPAPAALPPDFAGTWTVVDAAGQAQRVLTLAQDGAKVDGTLQSPSRVAKITGTIGGTRLAFNYQMLDTKGTTVASGTGNLDMGADGKSLSGVLMLNGLVLGNINAVRQ